MVCAACIVGIGISVGGTILIYRIVRSWWQDGAAEPPGTRTDPTASADKGGWCNDSNANNTNTDSELLEFFTPKTRVSTNSTADDEEPTEMYIDACGGAELDSVNNGETVRRRWRSPCDSSGERTDEVALLLNGKLMTTEHDSSRSIQHLPNDPGFSTQDGSNGNWDKMASANLGAGNGFMPATSSANSLPILPMPTSVLSLEHNHATELQNDLTSSVHCDSHNETREDKMIADCFPCSTNVSSIQSDSAFVTASTVNSLASQEAAAAVHCGRYSLDRPPPCNAHFHHSTPDDHDIAAAAGAQAASDSMYYDVDDVQLDAAKSLSWHDWYIAEPASSRSCISLDDSMFLRDFAFEEIDVLATCTAVTSLEQLEQEVAGVLSDCGDMERRVGALRLHEDCKSVAGRYSLGVADSVMAAERCRAPVAHCAFHDSPIVDEASLSVSDAAAAGRDSGYMWDDDGFGVELSASCSNVAHDARRRRTRSLSPLTTGRHTGAGSCHKHHGTRGSIGICVSAQTSLLNSTDPAPYRALPPVCAVGRMLPGFASR